MERIRPARTAAEPDIRILAGIANGLWMSALLWLAAAATAFALVG